ncbi:DNA phosphorothioation-associated putative methyltransferase [Spirulina subsalsa]|uniref:DNA phosphorothioation-associated putative methyltransferase n=1 Tax=Spirulina subsalsa TaxID=54311 RepID=UPI0022373240|nr:DNA phosphorothioation-associated putative methyltransferase [Spirulina subsalsa]
MQPDSEPFRQLVQKCQESPIGKHLPGALYIHQSALSALDPQLQVYEQKARTLAPQSHQATLIKFNYDRPTLSYLFYPDFDQDPHPALQGSIQVNLTEETVQYRDYSTSENPPILHRKETFVTPEYPHYAVFLELTRREENLGLLDDPRLIGTQREWNKRLETYGVTLEGHALLRHTNRLPIGQFPRIQRHKAAMVRKTLSRPVRAALEAELFSPETTFFDYGCGYGSDLEFIAQKGYISSGWDPYYRPDTPRTPADIVNLGYVINVIEDPPERREALIKAWELTQQVLIVAAQVLIRDNLDGQLAYGDGIITRRNTFQKYYEQEELKAYIDQVLGVDAIPVALGIYFVFRQEEQAEIFRAARFRSRATTPRVRLQVKKFEDYETLLTPLMAFITQRGRLPVKGELAQEEEILAEFGNFRRAFSLVLQATDEAEWEAIAEKRRQDLKLYLALTHFGKRPKAQEFSPTVKEDFKALFGSYKQACLLADMMLFSVGDLENLADLCQQSPIGKKRRQAFWIHISALETLDPLLRLYEGCASRTIGRLESATVIKFHLNQPKISYLDYPHFDQDPHPALHATMQIDLRDLHVSYWEADPENPPLLHRKEQLLTPDYPHYAKFARLSQQEEDRGLFDQPQAIRTRQDWLKYMAQQGVRLKNHCITWREDVDPYRLKVLRAALRRRQKQRRKRELS